MNSKVCKIQKLINSLNLEKFEVNEFVQREKVLKKVNSKIGKFSLLPRLSKAVLLGQRAQNKPFVSTCVWHTFDFVLSFYPS